ncbi:hypothetical protein VK98_06210 [Chromobacterium sp. LK11]|uniref:hypothetical protein n=1 Tax=Chromobacterium sp. LK11 TaxID=1628212 RepID=UPI0006538EDD|nr:hypothetical protein [Chromobacterium sp. LK11]KMN83068.1 hypothetical protein VK98_06210 [Chromobacterium sp. LK11]
MAARAEAAVRGGALLETMLALFVVMVSMLALSSVQLRALLHGRDALLRAEAIAAALELGEAALLWPEAGEASAQEQADWARLRQRLEGLGDGVIEARQCRGALDAMTEACAQQEGAVVYLRLTWNDSVGEDSARVARRYALALDAP